MITEVCGFIDDDGVFYKTKEDYEKTLLSNQYVIELELLVEEVFRESITSTQSKIWIRSVLKHLIESDIDINKLNELRTMYKTINQ